MIGAMIEPKDAAAPNNPCANALSFCGNHSALLFVVPGHGPASPSPSIILNAVSEKMPLDNAVKASAAPQRSTDMKNPFLRFLLYFHPIFSFPFSFIICLFQLTKGGCHSKPPPFCHSNNFSA